MDIDNTLLLAGLIFLAASLYSSVGHAGASGYLAAMALFGLAPMEMKPTALTLNVLVASIAVYKYTRAGRFSWSLFWPFALASVPFAYLGGLIQLPGIAYKPIIGAVLLYSAYHFIKRTSDADYQIRIADRRIILIAGCLLGFLSGLVGVGGGIFLSPLLILMRWEQVTRVSGIAALFILVNSTAGLLGFLTANTATLPDGIAYWASAAIAGGLLGSEYGSRRFGNSAIKQLLALVLLIAGVKMFVTL